MNTMNEFETMAKEMAEESVKSAKKIAGLNMNLWNSVASKQLEMFNILVETGVKQAELMSKAKDYNDYITEQTELSKSLGEKMTAKGQEVVEVINQGKDEYTKMVEEAVTDAQGKWEDLSKQKAA